MYRRPWNKIQLSEENKLKYYLAVLIQVANSRRNTSNIVNWQEKQISEQ